MTTTPTGSSTDLARSAGDPRQPAGRPQCAAARSGHPDLNDLLAVVARYGTPEEINRRAREAGALPALLDRVRETRPDYLADLEWLAEQRDRAPS